MRALVTAARRPRMPKATRCARAFEKLPNVPGKSVTTVLVNYAPGGKSVSPHHAGSVMAYVLMGQIRSENSATGPAKVYKAGEAFFEPPGSEHLVSENASTTEPASLLAIFVADDGAQLTTFEGLRGGCGGEPRAHTLRCHAPRMRGIQYAAASRLNR